MSTKAFVDHGGRAGSPRKDIHLQAVHVPAGTGLLHDLFDRHAQASPDRPALDIPRGSQRPHRVTATYGELSALADRIHVGLVPIARPDAIVATLLPRTTVAAFAGPLATLRAGAAFTSIDPAFPDARVADLIDDSQALAIITDSTGGTRLRRLGIDAARIVNVDELENTPEPQVPEPRVFRPGATKPTSLAYLIYTSGTTGAPKGVMIEHRAVVNLIESDLKEFQVGAGDRISQNSSHAYDSSLEETWLAFASGATLVVMDDEVARSGPDLVSWLDRESISVLCPTPTMLRATGRRAGDHFLPQLRLLYVGGEAITPDVVSAWAPGRRMVNGYGPTECAITSVRTDIRAGDSITIGRPVPNVAAYIVDESLMEVSDGESGELCLGGAGLARGYWRDPDLTCRKFPVHPRHGRLYRTGDLAMRAPDGTLTCFGRVDSQVKIRGYRIELEEIEARLAALEGVQGAACRVQSEGGRSTLVGFVVPADAASPPDLDRLHRALAATLPSHMVPAHLRVIDALPLMPSGKLNRAMLPAVATDSGGATDVVLPRTAMESRIEAALRRAVDRSTPISVTANFFDDLGGDSLLAAQLITALRADPDTAALTVRDAYAAPTIEQLARKATGLVELRPTPPRPLPAGGGRPILTTVLQVAWLTAGVILGSAGAYFALATAWPVIFADVPPLAIALGVPFAGAAALLCYIPISLAFVVLIKRSVIGKYQPGQWPVWGAFYARHWAVCQALRLVPWRMLEGTDFQLMALRALGARIGRRVHIHRGVDLLQGGWDLLTIGDNVMIGQEASIRVVELDDEELVAGAITIESDATIETRGSVAAGATIRSGGYLTALSSLPEGATIPRGERWDGVPAARAGAAPPVPRVDAPAREMSPIAISTLMLGSRVMSFMFVPTLIIWTSLFFGDARLRELLVAPDSWRLVLVTSMLCVPAAVIGHAIAIRLLGQVPPGIISRWSRDYLRVWVKTDLVRRAGDWLSGTLMWPIWLRAAGMRIGRDCEISTIIDVVPELVTIGPTTFFADGVYLAGPRLHRGTVTLAHTQLGSEVFLGNNVVIPAGCRVADRVLIGVSTVAGEPMTRAGTSWFGHPPFALARPEPPAMDKRLTHHPSLIRYVNRWVWELGRFAIPAVSALVLFACARAFVAMQAGSSAAFAAFVLAPGLVVVAGATLCGLVVIIKWLLLGRVRPGQHALWSCWCSRWDFMYTVWDRLAGPFLARFDGTLVLAWYLRAMGMRIGRRVVLGPGFAQVVDPDMIEIEDDATVHAMFQAHSFEDRVLKIDRVRIGRRATVASGVVLFYGADVGDGASVAAQSVIMKHERLLPHQRYEGCPSARVAEESVA